MIIFHVTFFLCLAQGVSDDVNDNKKTVEINLNINLNGESIDENASGNIQILHQ